jgi:hypothetical protein
LNIRNASASSKRGGGGSLIAQAPAMGIQQQGVAVQPGAVPNEVKQQMGQAMMQQFPGAS